MATFGHGPSGAIYEIANPCVPYSGPVRGPLAHGSMIFIRGNIQRRCNRMVINLEALNGNIVLHVNPRFNEGAVIRNTCKGSFWGMAEERGGGMPLVQGSPFECIILVQKGCYKIAFNGQHFTDYQHRLPKESVTILKVDGDLDLTNITFQGVPQPPPYIPMGGPDSSAGKIRMPEPGSGAPGFPHTIGQVPPPENPPPYGAPLFGAAAGQFPQTGGYAPPPSGGSAPPSKGSYAPPSSGHAPPSKRGYAPPSEPSPHGARPFGTAAQPGGHAPPSSGGYAPPSCPSGGYAPPSCPSGGYAPPSCPSGGYAPPSKGGYAPPSQPPGYAPAPAPSMPKPSGLPIYNPTVPFHGNLSYGMYAGRDVHVSGIPNYEAQRFTVNFQCGQAGHNIPFHFDVRLNERCIVGNTMQKNTWGQEIRVYHMPFRTRQNFDLRIHCGPKKYKAFVGNQLVMEFPHRVFPIEKAVVLKITGDVRLTFVRL